MNVTLDIHPTERTEEGLALLNLLREDGQRLCQVDIEYSKLAVFARPQPKAIDFLLLSASVYAMDKVIHRSTAVDIWTRELTLHLPVSDPVAWQSVQAELNTCLSFLTGDNWTIEFSAQGSAPLRPRRRRRRSRRPVVPPPTGDAVSLFSGGLDSLIGVIDWLEQPPPRHLLLVGHHDPHVPGPYSDQQALLEPLRQSYQGRIKSVLARVSHSQEVIDETEITLRGRSLIFVALGVFVASALGPNVPLLIPENGTIALNVPLTPSRRGSCSTRTAHPYYLSALSQILARVGLTNPISNPLENKTKGEAIAQCRNQAFLNTVAHLAVSCAKRNRRMHWKRRQAKSCGYCMPCIYRRAAMHSVGWDDEVYGDDICAGEVNLDDAGETPNDLRACFSFLNRKATNVEIATMLMANGRLDPPRLRAYSAMVSRTMDEIRALLRAKASPEIRRLAGIP